MTNRQRFPWGRRVAASFAAVLLVSASTSARAHPAGAPDAQTARVGQICASVMRLEPGEAQYVGCVDSLSRSARGVGEGRALQGAHEACLAHGLEPGGADLALCTLQSSQGRPLDIKAPDPVLAAQAPGGAKSYFSVSNRDQMRREQLACARLGLDPTSSGFDGCVANLRSSLFAADNPSQ